MFLDKKQRRSNKMVEIPNRDWWGKINFFFNPIKRCLSWLFSGYQYLMMIKFLLIVTLLLIWGLEIIFGIHILPK